jgi:thiosulfate/3-mercaptopyruvate sulfurtransferase
MTGSDLAYANDVLVSAEWVAERLDSIQSDDPSLRLVEVDLNTDFYEEGHVPGAVGFDWHSQLRHRRRRDLPSPSAFGELLATHGIDNDSTIVVYGDNSNWFAAHFYWLLSYYGHEDVYLLDGGREYWVESDRPTSTTVPSYTARTYTTSGTFEDIRAYREDVRRAIESDNSLVDVRLPEEYDGTLVAPPGIDEWAQRAGHIPGAVNVVWSENLEPDGRFRAREALEELYRQHGITDDGSVIAYCRIGERSSLTWFVLSELLGFQSVQNYDGSWTEWGNLVGVPIETDTETRTTLPAMSDSSSQ